MTKGGTPVKKFKTTAAIALAAALLLLAGCGSSTRESGGAATAGVGAIGFGECYNCHADSKNPASFQVVFGDSAASVANFQGWISSRHMNANNSPSNASVSAACTPCHDPTGDGQTIAAFVANTGITIFGTSNRPLVGCEGCHGGGGNHWGIGPLPYEKPSPYVCYGCHPLKTAGGSIDNTAFHDPLVNPAGSNSLIIADTHFDNPLTQNIEGYIINESGTYSKAPGNANSGTCNACHNPHGLRTSINVDWSRSGHSGFINDVKTSGGRDAAVQDNPPISNPWAHYDFRTRSGGACARCHTSTGFRTLASSPSTYATPPTSATSSVTELLYCWACHIDNLGTPRNPGTFVSPGSDYTYPAGRSIPSASIGKSNICVNCHSGRETGQTIVDYTGTLVGQAFGNFNSHYLAAGGIIFRTIGYEFAGRSYATPSFEHGDIGTSAGPAALGTTSGPCVGCHMKTSDSHRFNPVTRDAATDLVLTINNNAQVCTECHGGGVSAAELNTLETQFNASLDALAAQYLGNGICYNGVSYPYFFVYNTTMFECTTTSFTEWTSKNLLGTAFNFQLLTKMPMAFVHNSQYVRYLLYDSIDFMDNGLIDNSVEATLAAGDAYDFLNGQRP